MFRRRLRRFKGWLLPATVLFGSGVLGAVRDMRSGDVSWTRDVTAALRQARQTDQPLLMSFRTPGCGWCAKLDAEAFADPDVVRLSQRFVCVRLDSDIDADVCTRYRVQEFPTTLLADPAGRVFARVSGYVSPGRLVPILRAALTAEGGRSGALASSITSGCFDIVQGPRQVTAINAVPHGPTADRPQGAEPASRPLRALGDAVAP